VNGRNNRNDEKKEMKKEMKKEDGRKKILLAFLLTIWMIS
tara:strand:+ start:739 stop:858 length:120 start_codon:yes stop_codon:yes gene_type:complete